MTQRAWGLGLAVLAAAAALRLGGNVSAAEPSAWLEKLPAPAYSLPGTIDEGARATLVQQVQSYAARAYSVQVQRVFAVAADTTPNMVQKNFANAAAEQGAKPLAYDGPELFDHGLAVAAFFEHGWVRKQRVGVAMQRAQPGQASALVAYFTLQPK